MIKRIAFQTRARAVDHLGREQIADCPTAISELWKNAYDAYAQKVELHIFNPETPEGMPVAAIVDDGHGMNEDEVRNKWFVIGTDSKLSSHPSPNDEDRGGLAERVKQGQKGIGRLSSGALGSLLLLVSKRRNDDYVAALIDWRIFENPYLLLNDIFIPIATFKEKEELSGLVEEMFDDLLSNIEPQSDDDSERACRLRQSWELYNQFEREQGLETLTSEKIISTIIGSSFSVRHFQVWPVWEGKSEKGTALFFLNIHDELEYQLDCYKIENDSVKDIIDRFKKTLAGFTDPFLEKEEESFQYGIYAWRGCSPDKILSSEDQYDWQTFCGLEHIIDGQIDEKGVFSGRIKAFGEYHDNIKISTLIVLPQKGTKYVGPVNIKIGTFEQVKSNTSLTDEAFAFWEEQCSVSAGMGVYRDNLRVLPYGRVDNDFFEIEYRRSKHAGREFWVARRLFGRILITKKGNPNLKDKAGREGFIDNGAKKLFKQLIINVLMESARRFFGTDSEIRKETLPELNKEHARRDKEEAAKARKMTIGGFRKKLNHNIGCLEKLLSEFKDLSEDFNTAVKNKNSEDLLLIQSKAKDLGIQRVELRLPPKPTRSTVLDEKIDAYNSDYRSFASSMDDLSVQIENKIQELSPKPPEEILAGDARTMRSMMTAKLNKWFSEIEKVNKSIAMRLNSARENQEQRMIEKILILDQNLQKGLVGLADVLRQQRELRDQSLSEVNTYYEPFVNILSSLAEGIDMDSATRYNIRENERLQSELDQYTSLAQLGITTEIVSHELGRWEHNLSDYLDSLPQDIKKTPRYAEAVSTQKELTGSLRFLDTLKLSGRKYSRRDISGTMIRESIERFFFKTFEKNKISFEVSEKFERMYVNDWTSDIYPVFLNVINNACYWVCQTSQGERKIKIDIIDGAVVIADSGPGVSESDQEHLFDLFFSKRLNGRGVGLYLCRRNLAKSGHTIDYISEENDRILPGANFKITFAEMLEK